MAQAATTSGPQSGAAFETRTQEEADLIATMQAQIKNGQEIQAAPGGLRSNTADFNAVGVVGNLKPSDSITWTDRQLQRKHNKHAADFGVSRNCTPHSAKQFKQALKDFVDQPHTVKIQGTYRGQPVTLYTDLGYSKVVLVSPGGEFVSGWKLADQRNNLKQRHSL